VVGAIPTVPSACVGTLTSALVSARHFFPPDGGVRNLVLTQIHQENARERCMHVNLRRGARCSTVICACMTARSSDLPKLKKFRKIYCS